MAKKLQEWLDEFIENGFSPDVSHWPEEGSVETNQPSVNITPSTSEQTILPDDGYVGFNQAVVAAVDNTIDDNIQAGNIKKNVTILGVTGNYEAPEVPTYTGPYNITENSTIAISGKQATQNITVNVPSPTYTNNHAYYYGSDILELTDLGTIQNGYLYFFDSNNEFIESTNSGSGIYEVVFDYDNDEVSVNKISDSTMDTNTLYRRDQYGIRSEGYYGGEGYYWLAGSNSIFLEYGNYFIHNGAGGSIDDGVYLINSYGDLFLYDNIDFNPGLYFYDGYSLSGADLADGALYLYSESDGITSEMDPGIYNGEGNYMIAGSNSFSLGEGLWILTDTKDVEVQGISDCTQMNGLYYFDTDWNNWSASAEEIEIPSNIGDTTTVEFGGNTYTITKTA